MVSKYFKIDQIDLSERYESGVKRGDKLGFYSSHECFSVKLGTTLYLYGSPASGKTQFKYEMLLQLSELYGYNHVIYDPETGTAEDIKEMLVEMYAKADLTKSYNNQMSEAALIKAETFLNEHFFIFDPQGEDTSLKEFYEKVQQIEHEQGKKIHTASLDPWDYLKHDFKEFENSGRDDRYLMEALKFVYRDAVKNNRYNIIVHHTRDIPMIKVGNKFVQPAPTPFDLAFGQEWFRKGMAMIGVYRPSTDLQDDNGVPYEWNDTLILLGKLKPKGVADPLNRKKQFKLKYDAKAHRYYEEYNGVKRFSTGFDTGTAENRNTFIREDGAPF